MTKKRLLGCLFLKINPFLTFLNRVIDRIVSRIASMSLSNQPVRDTYFASFLNEHLQYKSPLQKCLMLFVLFFQGIRRNRIAINKQIVILDYDRKNHSPKNKPLVTKYIVRYIVNGFIS